MWTFVYRLTLTLFALLCAVFIPPIISKDNSVGMIIFLLIFIVPIGAAYVLNLNMKNKQKISMKKDEFNGVSWIYSAEYKGCRYRALLKDNVLHVIQLYIETNNSDWVYFNSAHGEDQAQLKFIEVDSDVKTHGFGDYKEVRTHEIFALDIPFDYLERMSTKDWKIKAYGKRADRVFTIPKKMSQPFCEYIKPYIIANTQKV